MKEQVQQLDIHRAATILERGGRISTNPREKDTFVIYDGQLAVGGSRITHRRAALRTGLYYPEEDTEKPIVDDAGEIYDDGEELIITPYFTKSTRPKLLREDIFNNKRLNINEVKKEIRRETGQLISNIMGRKVVVEHEDESKNSFSPL